eukprot:Hpha_TRINITY_DN15726_c2_g5::TRINITY_DN15726_c2_g5_i3::g.40263::m.40263
MEVLMAPDGYQVPADKLTPTMRSALLSLWEGTCEPSVAKFLVNWEENLRLSLRMGTPLREPPNGGATAQQGKSPTGLDPGAWGGNRPGAGLRKGRQQGGGGRKGGGNPRGQQQQSFGQVAPAPAPVQQPVRGNKGKKSAGSWAALGVTPPPPPSAGEVAGASGVVAAPNQTGVAAPAAQLGGGGGWGKSGGKGGAGGGQNRTEGGQWQRRGKQGGKGGNKGQQQPPQQQTQVVQQFDWQQQQRSADQPAAIPPVATQISGAQMGVLQAGAWGMPAGMAITQPQAALAPAGGRGAGILVSPGLVPMGAQGQVPAASMIYPGMGGVATWPTAHVAVQAAAPMGATVLAQQSPVASPVLQSGGTPTEPVAPAATETAAATAVAPAAGAGADLLLQMQQMQQQQLLMMWQQQQQQQQPQTQPQVAQQPPQAQPEQRQQQDITQLTAQLQAQPQVLQATAQLPQAAQQQTPQGIPPPPPHPPPGAAGGPTDAQIANFKLNPSAVEWSPQS